MGSESQPAAATRHQRSQLTVTFDGASRRGLIYIDGAFEAGAVFPAFTPQSSVAPTFGRASWFDAYYAGAVLDRTRLFSQELTAPEVQSEFASSP